MITPEQIFINGMGLSGVYMMVALGLSLLFGVLRVLNFAHGELYMVGAYGVWLLYVVGDLPFPAAVAVSVLIVGAIGLILERGIFRPLRGKPMSCVIGAIGAMFMIQVMVGQSWGLGVNKIVPYAFTQILHFFSANFSVHRLIVIISSISVIVGLWIFLRRTKLGRAIRACAQNPEAASLQGISINRMGFTTMALSGALAGLAGALIAPLVIVNPYIGSQIILKAFVVIIVGGMGSIEGSILAAFIFGFLDSSLTSLADSTIANMIDLSLMLGILSIRPRGLLGREA